MRFTKTLSVIITIFLLIQSYLCQQEQHSIVLTDGNNNTLLSNETLSIGDVVPENSLKPKTIIRYSPSVILHEKYSTDEENYTSIESIEFSIRTNQHISQAITILLGVTHGNINYIFNIENGRPKFIFSQGDLPSLILTTRNHSDFINNGQWHRLYVQRSDRKLRFILDNVKQTDTEWQGKTNIFIGAELTPVPNKDYRGEVGDITVTNSGRSLTLRQDDQSNKNIKYSTTPINQALAFLPNDNNEIIYPSPTNSTFQTLSFSFRTHSNLSTIIQFEEVNLNIDINGYLSLAIQDKSTRKIFSNKHQKPINDGNSYPVQFELNNQTLQAWIDQNQKISIKLSSSSLIIKNFIFGSHNQFIGCIENVIYNNKTFSFQHLSSNRRTCSSRNAIYIDQIISFNEYNRPIIITLDTPTTFHLFSFLFYTQESNSIICSLADKTHENLIILSIRYEHLLLTYINKQNKQIEISMNKSVNDRNEHKIIIDANHLLIELDGNILMKNISDLFNISTIYFGKLDSSIKERFPDLDRGSFIGCIRDVKLNEKSLIKLQHVYKSNRLANICQVTKRERK